MDLEATWQEHKKFIVSVGVGALAFGIFASGIKGFEASADTGARSNASAQSNLLREIQTLRGAEANEKGKKIALEEKAAPEIRKTILWTVPPEFVPKPEDTLPGATYEKLRATAVEEMGKRADKLGVTMPRNAEHRCELSLPSGEGLTGPVLAEKFARVDVTTKILNAILDAGVKKVDRVNQDDPSYMQLEARETEQQSYLRGVKVSVIFEGTLLQLSKVLQAFEQESSFLELEKCRVVRPRDARPDGTESRLSIEVGFSALTIEKDVPADWDKSSSGPDKGKGHGGKGRDR